MPVFRKWLTHLLWLWSHWYGWVVWASVSFISLGLGARHAADAGLCLALPVKSSRVKLCAAVYCGLKDRALCHLLSRYLRNCPSLCVAIQTLARNFEGQSSVMFSTFNWGGPKQHCQISHGSSECLHLGWPLFSWCFRAVVQYHGCL